MNTFLRSGAFRVQIYIDDHKPRHVHVIGGGGEAKVNLDCDGEENGVELVDAYGLNRSEIRKAVAIVAENREFLIGKWESIHGA